MEDLGPHLSGEPYKKKLLSNAGFMTDRWDTKFICGQYDVVIAYGPCFKKLYHHKFSN